MPRRMRLAKRRRATVTRRLSDLPFDQKFNLMLPWAPGKPLARADEWATWGAYLETYESVRDELLEHLSTHQHIPARTPFAEKVFQYRERHGAAALADATYSDIEAEYAGGGDT